MSRNDSLPNPILQACVVPYRRRGDRIEFCLITSLKYRRWILPKGIIDPGETPEQTALKEALEEAGLVGQIVGEPLGVYEDKKWGTTLSVTVFLMQVTRCQDQWLEAEVRDRRWVDPAAASELLSKKEARPFLEAALLRLRDD